ncbi:MAG: hypothetical protein ACYTGB_06020 [Planctomycetota bacterium]
MIGTLACIALLTLSLGCSAKNDLVKTGRVEVVTRDARLVTVDKPSVYANDRGTVVHGYVRRGHLSRKGTWSGKVRIEVLDAGDEVLESVVTTYYPRNPGNGKRGAAGRYSARIGTLPARAAKVRVQYVENG